MMSCILNFQDPFLKTDTEAFVSEGGIILNLYHKIMAMYEDLHSMSTEIQRYLS